MGVDMKIDELPYFSHLNQIWICQFYKLPNQPTVCFRVSAEWPVSDCDTRTRDCVLQKAGILEAKPTTRHEKSDCVLRKQTDVRRTESRRAKHGSTGHRARIMNVGS
nr:hypothetical protein Itr_chr02CG13640 [Ipomoea trifida]